MCQPDLNFKFCTCEEKEPPSTDAVKNLPDYTWYLTRFKGTDQNGPMGSIAAPSKDLGAGLTIDRVLELLNSGEAFDFEYIPFEKDQIRIHKKDSISNNYHGYMTCLFENSQWTDGMNDTFSTISEDLAKGKICKI